jgi:tight adherence protein C
MELYAILGLVFSAVFLIVLMPGWMMARKNSPSARRYRNLDDELSGKSEDKSKKRSKSDISVKQRAQKVLAHIQLNTKKKKKINPKIEERLLHAGFRNENAAAVLNGIKMVSAGLFFTAAFVPLSFGLIENPLATNPMLIAFGVGFFGFGIPDMVLGRMAKKRQTIIDESLPDALDLLVICVEAGLGLNAAILRTGQDIKLRWVKSSCS